MNNLPYLLPYVDELRPRSIIDFGCGRSDLVDELAQAAGAEAVRYDPAIPEHSAKPEGKFDLLLSVDVLEHVPEADIEPVIAQMAACAKKAIIIIDTDAPASPETQAIRRDRDWWAEKLGAHFPYLEPIRVRSKRRAAFKTWRSDDSRQLPHFMIFLRAELKYRFGKLTNRR